MQIFRSIPTGLVLLLALFAVIVLLLVLPDVDPPETAFQRNTSPLALHSHSHSIPQVALSSILAWLVLVLSPSLCAETRKLSIPTSAVSIQVLHHSFRC